VKTVQRKSGFSFGSTLVFTLEYWRSVAADQMRGFSAAHATSPSSRQDSFHAETGRRVRSWETRDVQGRVIALREAITRLLVRAAAGERAPRPVRHEAVRTGSIRRAPA
jgi:hypothetical protein